MRISSISSGLKTFALDAASGFSNAFTSANDSPIRTSTEAMPTDSRRELTFRNRISLVKKSRWLRNNLGVYRRFISGTARYAVGGGIVHIPDTSDTEWNKAADEYFDDWASNEVICDVRGKLPFWKIQKQTAKSMMGDGDSFVIKVGNGDQSKADGSTMPGLPQLQWLESTFVSNKLSLYSMNGFDEEGFREGIRSNPLGKALAYKILKDLDPRTFDLQDTQVIPADAMRHLYDAERATAIRGLPWAYHGMNSALDIMDIVSLEKAAVKLHSSLSGAIRKRSGDAGKGSFTGDLFRQTGVTLDGKPKVTAYENFAGGAGILQLGLDEEFQLFSSNRANDTFGKFIDFLVRDMAWGFGVSPEFIWSVAGLSGPNARLILEDANWFFEEVQDLMVYLLCRPIYTWVISRAVLRGELPECKDPKWWRCHWQGPAKITIDEGRTGQLELAQLEAGAGTLENFWAKRGKSSLKMRQQRIDEIAEDIAYCTKKKVPYEFYRAMKPGTPSGSGGAGTASTRVEGPDTVT